MSAPEFVPIIMAGGSGSRMYPLSHAMPKCLLPVANRPLLEYQLDMLQRSHFTGVILVTTQSQAQKVNSYVQETYKGPLNVSVKVIPDENLGTCDALRLIKNDIKTDFLVISSDLVSDVLLHRVVDVHRLNDATVTALLHKQPREDLDSGKPSPTRAPEIDAMRSDDYIGLGEVGQDGGARLLFMASEADLESSIPIPRRIYERFPEISLHKTITDAHVYVCSKAILQVLDENKQISRIKGELIPFLVRRQFSRKLTLPETNEKIPLSVGRSDADRLDRVRCFSYIMRGGLCVRANTPASYMAVNMELVKGMSATSLPKRTDGRQSADIERSPPARVSDSVLGERCRLGERTSVKRSAVGHHCSIGNNVKISNSVVMDHVTIRDGCVITNSIICNDANLEEHVFLQLSKVGTGYTVPEKSEAKNGVFAVERSHLDL